MKRDLDLVRKILFALEEHPHGRSPDVLEFDGYTEEQIGYHIHIMGDGGLLIVADNTDRGSLSPMAVPLSMTWAGHEFADTARSEKLWNKAKSTIREKLGSASVAVVTDYLKRLANDSLGLPGIGG